MTLPFPLAVETDFRYHRVGDVVHVATHGFTNHELRALIVGLWLSLDEADRVDHVGELLHYLEPDSRPPGASMEIAAAILKTRQ